MILNNSTFRKSGAKMTDFVLPFSKVDKSKNKYVKINI